MQKGRSDIPFRTAFVYHEASRISSEAPDQDIYFYINGPGGSVTAGFAIYDTMQIVKPKVHTICVGFAASFAAMLLMGGEPGYRFALPNSEIMIHQPHGGAQRQTSDIAIIAKRFMETRSRIYRIASERTGQPIERIERDMDRDTHMPPKKRRRTGSSTRPSRRCNHASGCGLRPWYPSCQPW